MHSGLNSTRRTVFTGSSLEDLEKRLLTHDDPSVSTTTNRSSSYREIHRGASYSTNSVGSQQSSHLDRYFNPDSVVIEGDEDLEAHERKALLKLEELQACKRLKLQKPTGVKSNSVYFMSPLNTNGDAMLPTVIKIKELDAARREVAATIEGRTHFGDYAMRLIDFVGADQIGVLQLEISGSRCCIPRFVDAVEATKEYGARFSTAVMKASSKATKQKDVDALDMNRVLSMANEIFVAVLRPCAFRTAENQWIPSFLEMLEGKKVKMRVLGPSADTKFGPDYYDGLKSLPAYGGLADDLGTGSVSDVLLSMVESVTGRRQRPSDFFASFYTAVEGAPADRLTLRTINSIVHNDLHFGNVMVDADDRLWIIDLETVRKGHIFTDIAKGLGSALFCYSGDLEEEDEDMMQRLMLIWASAPHSIANVALPLAPEGCSASAHCRWLISRQMQRHFANFSSPPPRKSNEGLVEPRLDLPHLHMLWAIFTMAMQMATYKQNKDHPRCKRLALYLSLAAASRVAHELGVMEAPDWLAKHQSLWVPFKCEGGAPEEAMSAGLERYSVTVRSKEAWVRDPFTHQRFDVLNDTVEVVLTEHGMEHNGNNKTKGYKDVCEMLKRRQKMVVVGAPGSGKTVLTKQVITHLLNDGNCGGRLPLRIPLIDLSPRDRGQPDDGDALGAYIKQTFEERIAVMVNSVRDNEGLILVMDGLDEADPEKTWIVTWIHNLLVKEPNHLILITTRPSAFEVRSRSYNNPLWRWWTKQTVPNMMKFTHDGVKAAGFVICEIQEFGKKQLKDLSRSRLGTEVAGEIEASLMKPAYKDLVRMPLLATMVMHMLLQQLESNSTYVLTHCDVYQFAFMQLLRHVDAAKRRRPKEYDQLKDPELLIIELAYKKQSSSCKTIKEEDLCQAGTGSDGPILWKIARSGQLALFEVVGEHLQFFHLTMQEFLAATYTLHLLQSGQDWPAWLLMVDEFAIGAHHFFGALAELRGFKPSEKQKEEFLSKNRGAQEELVKMLRKAVATDDDFGIEGIFSLFSLVEIQELNLELNGTGALQTLDQVCAGIQKLTQLQELSLDFSTCFNLQDVRALSDTWAKLVDLQELSIDLTRCHSAASPELIGEGFSHLTRLRSLSVAMSGCVHLYNLDAFGKGLRSTLQLSKLSLNFEGCGSMTSISELGFAMQVLVKLESLYLDVSRCTAIVQSGVDEVGKGLAELQKLQYLTLRFTNTSKDLKLDEVRTGISKIPKLLWLKVEGFQSTSFRASQISRYSLRNLVVVNYTNCLSYVRWTLLWIFFIGQFIFLVSTKCDMPGS